MQTFTIDTNEAKDRLDKYLTTKLPGFSRSQIQKSIKTGLVLINNKTVTPHYPLKKGDIVTTEIKPILGPSITPNKSLSIKIIDEQTDYLIVEKNAGIAVHPATGIKDPTLIEGILAKYPEIKKVGDNELRPGIVQRLDKEVSGLMVIAKTPAMFTHLKKQFKKHSIIKEYTALVHGVMTPSQEHGIIDKPVGRSANNSGRMAAQTDKTSIGQEAKTEYWVITRFSHHTLLRVKIHTGRTHQIRVHLNSLSFPIVGDRVYNNKRIKLVELGRIFLHATKLGFKDLSKNYQEYESPLPIELNNFLKTIK